LDFCWKNNDDYRLKLATPICVFSVLNEIRREDLPGSLQNICNADTQSMGTDTNDFITAWINNGTINQNDAIIVKCEIYQQSGHTVTFGLNIRLNGNALPEITIV